jgi:hypothetical protein
MEHPHLPATSGVSFTCACVQGDRIFTVSCTHSRSCADNDYAPAPRLRRSYCPHRTNDTGVNGAMWAVFKLSGSPPTSSGWVFSCTPAMWWCGCWHGLRQQAQRITARCATCFGNLTESSAETQLEVPDMKRDTVACLRACPLRAPDLVPNRLRMYRKQRLQVSAWPATGTC